LQELVV